MINEEQNKESDSLKKDFESMKTIISIIAKESNIEKK